MAIIPLVRSFFVYCTLILDFVVVLLVVHDFYSILHHLSTLLLTMLLCCNFGMTSAWPFCPFSTLSLSILPYFTQTSTFGVLTQLFMCIVPHNLFIKIFNLHFAKATTCCFLCTYTKTRHVALCTTHNTSIFASIGTFLYYGFPFCTLVTLSSFLSWRNTTLGNAIQCPIWYLSLL